MNQYRIIFQMEGQSQPESEIWHSWDAESAKERFEEAYPDHEVLDVEPLNK